MTVITRLVKFRLPFAADPISRVALLCLVALALVGAAGPVAHLGGNPNAIAFPRLVPPGPEFLFGTDTLGRSLLPRVVEGIRPTFVIAAAAVLIASFAGTAIGMLAAYVGSIADEVVVRAADVLFSFPGMLMALMVAVLAGRGVVGPVVTIVLVTIPLMVRVARAATLRVKGRDYVVAARVSSASTVRILSVHVLPSIAGPVVVQATYALSIAMLIEGGMSFLGLGVQPPNSSLGTLLEQGKAYITVAPWMVLAPGLTLALAILSVNLVGDGMRDALEPRQSRTLT